MMSHLPKQQFDKLLKEGGLCYILDNSPGFFRQNKGKSFVYYDVTGNRITGEKDLSRIKKLAIPPAWNNVWISPKSNIHLQATGIDAKKRKQYIYHSDWIKISQENKFENLSEFGLSLPKIRGKVKYGLNKKAFDKEKLLATVVWLLENTFIRIGNDEYYKENNSFGLTTLRNKHVKVIGQNIFFTFKGKSGVISNLTISNPKIAKTIKRCIELPGYELFSFFDTNGNRHVIDSADVNLFLKDVTGNNFSAKDFRTWGGTSISAKNLFKLGFPEDKRSIKKNIVDTVKKVASHLNNTTSVCKNYYIHPTVFVTYQKNILIPHFDYYAKSKKSGKGLNWNEYALVKLLNKHS